MNGARQQDTSVTIDGAPAMRTRANGAVIGVANVDATEEIQVLTADYAAEYGRASGGQIRMVSKSGTTRFSWKPVRVSAQFRHERQHVDAQPKHGDEFHPASGIQQFRRHHRRARVGRRA